MDLLHLGSSDLSVSRLCYGTGPFGTAVRGAELHRLYDTFREAGGNFFDTAHCYCFWIENGHGASERALGECVRRSGDRQQVVIATKGGHPAGGSRYPRPDRYLAPEVVAKDIDESLDRLGIDRIDLYFLHRDDPRVPVAEIITMLNAEVTRGRIRYLGASNWTTQRIAAANAYATAHGLAGFVASQPQWNLAQPNAAGDPTMRFLSREDERWHARQQFPVIAYSSTARGYFASGGQLAAADYDNATSRSRLRRAQELATRRRVSANQIALAYLMNQEFPVVPITGTVNPQHLVDAIQATSLRLTPKEVHWLRGSAD